MTSSMVTSDDCRIAFRLDGGMDMPVLLLANALGTSIGMWAPQMPGFTEHFRVLRYDIRGQGASDAPVDAYSIERLGQDVIELLDELKIPQVSFCGHSLGGLIGIWLAIHHPHRLQRLILTSTSGHLRSPAEWDDHISLALCGNLATLANESIAHWFTPDFRWRNESAIRAVETFLLDTRPDGYAGCCAAIRNSALHDDLCHIGVPTLVIAGTHDPLITYPDCQELIDAIPGSQLRLLDTAHLANIERPAAFTDICLSFLTQTEACRPPAPAPPLRCAAG